MDEKDDDDDDDDDGLGSAMGSWCGPGVVLESHRRAWRAIGEPWESRRRG
jgi:hypothetical protein